MFVANGQGTEEIGNRIHLARSSFSRLQLCLWSRREILFCTKGRVYQAVVRSILFFGCETCWVRVAGEMMLEMFDNNAYATFYTSCAEIVCHPRNCVDASALQAYRHCSCKEGSVGLDMPQDVPNVSWSRTFSFPHRLARWADELEASLDMGNHDQGRPGNTIRTASLRPRTMGTGLGESI